MSNEEFQELVLVKLNSLEEGQAKLEKGQAKLEEGQAKLEEGQTRLELRQSNLEKGQLGLVESLERLREDFEDFKIETRGEFIVTRTLINQAFERISDNLSYQEKIIEIEKFLHSRPRSLNNTY